MSLVKRLLFPVVVISALLTGCTTSNKARVKRALEDEIHSRRYDSRLWLVDNAPVLPGDKQRLSDCYSEKEKKDFRKFSLKLLGKLGEKGLRSLEEIECLERLVKSKFRYEFAFGESDRTDEEIERTITFWQETHPHDGSQAPPWDALLEQEAILAQKDQLIDKAIAIVQETQRASASMLQRRLRIGYPRAARLIDELEELGVVGPSRGGGREREVLIGPDDDLSA